jgi:hypothetical protein
MSQQRIKVRPRGWQLKKDLVIVKTHIQPCILTWMNKYCSSRQRALSDIGTNALFLYFYSFNWAYNWVSIEETVTTSFNVSPERRNDYMVTGYVPKSYLTWLDSLPQTLDTLTGNFSPEYWKELKHKYFNKVLTVRSRSMHLKRALIIYYKLCQVRPAIVELDFDCVRPDDYFWDRHDFNNNNYLFAYTNKVGSLLQVDMSQKCSINLLEMIHDQ